MRDISLMGRVQNGPSSVDQVHRPTILLSRITKGKCLYILVKCFAASSFEITKFIPMLKIILLGSTKVTVAVHVSPNYVSFSFWVYVAGHN